MTSDQRFAGNPPLAYRIHFCDRSHCPGKGHCHCFSPISSCTLRPAKLQLVIQEIPVLKNILFGHPAMQASPIHPDPLGICHLYLHPDYGVTAKGMEDLAHCLLSIRNGATPPALTNEVLTAVQAAEKFGGCIRLDHYQHLLNEFHSTEHRVQLSPTIPAEDVNQQFEWRMVGPIGRQEGWQSFSTHLQELQKDGFDFACFVTPSQSPDHYIHMRRRRTGTSTTAGVEMDGGTFAGLGEESQFDTLSRAGVD